MGHRHEDDGIAGKASNDVRDPGPPPLTNPNQSPKSEPAVAPALWPPMAIRPCHRHSFHLEIPLLPSC